MSNKYDGSDPMIEAEVTIDPARPVKPAKPPEGGSPLGRLDAEALESQRAHERDLADRGARPVEDREPGMPVYPPFGQSGVPLVDDNGAPFPEETQQLFREVAQDAYLRGTRDQRDREPVGPYAPTRTGPTIDRDGNITYPNPVGEAAEAINGKINALTDVMGERFGRIDTALTKLTDLFVDSRDEIERTMTRPEYLRWKEGFDFGIKGFAEEMATARRETREAFERGRQQGDADRAQRGELATDEEMNAPISDQAQKNVREALMSAEEHRHRGYEAGFSGGKIVGAAEREAELLDQGWTPPGVITEQIAATTWDPFPGHWTADERTAERQHREKLLSLVAEIEARTLAEQVDYPTDYEVWRDAVAVAGGQRDRRIPAKDLAERLTADAEWFWELLQQVPVRKYDDADEYVCEACGDEFPSAGQRAAHEDEKHAANGQ